MGPIARTHAQGRGRWEDEWTLDSAPPDDEEWKESEESQVPPSPSKVHAPSGTNSAAGSADNKAPPGALWPDAYNQNVWKVPPIAPPPTLQQAGGIQGSSMRKTLHR